MLGGLPKGMLKFRIDRPITSWARTLLVVKKWFKWNREQWFFPFALNLKKKTFPTLLNVIVTKNYSLCARYSNMLSESWETFHFTYTTALRVSFRKSFLKYFSDTVWRQHGVFAEELCMFEQVILTLFAWFEYPWRINMT